MALTTFWQDQLEIYEDEREAAQGDLTAAQDLRKKASAQLAQDLKSLDQVTAGIAAMRAKLAVTTVPAEANAMITQITAKIIEQRGLQGMVLDGRDALAAAAASADAADTTLKRATARIASVKANIAQAAGEDAQRSALKQAAAPLNPLKIEAGQFFNSVKTDARKGLEKNFPTEIITLAGQRYQTRIHRLADLQSGLDKARGALGSELATDRGLEGVVSQKLIDLQRSQDVLAQYVATAASRFQKAQAVMQMLEAIGKDTTPDLPGILTPAEAAQLFPPAAVAAAGATASGVANQLAIDTQKAVDDAAHDKADAEQAARDQVAAESLAAELILAAGEAAAKAAVVGASQEDKDAAKDAADLAAKAQDDAAQAAADTIDAENKAALSAAAAQDAIAVAAASPKARIIDICLDAVFRAQDDLDDQILTQIDTGVDQLSTDPAVAAKRTAITTATTTYDDARAAFAAANKEDLDQWEAVIPDTAWKVLLDYEEAVEALGALSAADPVQMAKDMNDAEAAYADALGKAELARRKADALGDAIVLRAQRLTAAQAAITNRLPSAIRGDSY